MKRLSALLILAISCLCAAAQSITVTSPNGGELWNTGSSQTITWTSSGVSQVNIEVSEDGGLTWSLIATVNAVPGSFSWNVGGSGTMQALVRITDGSNNTINDVSNGTFIIGPQATVNAGPDAVICYGTTAQLNATSAYYSNPGGGGPPPPPPGATYSWSPAAGLSDANIANPIASPSVTTVYTVTVDYGGVQAVDNVTITVDNPIAGITIVNPISCSGVADGQICALVTGGSGGNTYLWNTGSTSSCQTNLSAGTYMLSVVDGMGCSDSASVTLNEPVPLTISFTTTNVSCNGAANGSVCPSVSGSTAPYAFAWNNGATTSCISNLVAGSYTITVTSSSGCTATATAVVNQPTALNISLNTVNVTCNGTANGSITATVTGGTPAYTYSWSNGVNTPAVVGAISGTYNLTVTDMNGCTATASATINQPTPINITITGTDVTCHGLSNGQLCAAVTGGVAPYVYMWDAMGTAPCFSGIPIGTYTLVITDNNGCTATSAGTVLEQSNLQDSITTTGGGCSGQPANACINAYGGAGAVTFLWSNSQNTQCVTGLSTGTYYATITDALGCAAIDSAVITAPGALTDNLSITNVFCAGGSTGSISVTASNGVSPYQYSINGIPLQSSGLFNNLAAGGYSIYILDASGCWLTDTATIAEPTPLVATINSFNAGALPDTLDVVVTGGTAPYAYAWNQGANTQSIEITVSSIYFVTITDANGCTQTDTVFSGCIGYCVWPGDADYNGIVDNNDLLATGIAYGASGTARLLQDNNWYGHSAQEWTDTLSTGSNYKHIDCDGNGSINADDTLAIVQNYSLTHARSGTDEWRGGAPELRIQIVPDTLADGQTVIAHLSLGDAIVPASNVYALAFTFNYDALVVDSNEVSISFDNNSWLCNSASDHLDIDKKFYSSGRIETALTRIDHTNRSGTGEIGSVSMKITTGNINGKNLAYYAMQCSISDLVVIDKDGNHLAVNAGADSSTVEYEPTGLVDISAGSILSLYPNPVKDELNLSSVGSFMLEVEIVDALGRPVMHQLLNNAGKATISVSDFADGLYFIKVKSTNGTAYSHFIKSK
ncbi:MAG: T9SS type A sorting domain-containing protein [Chitinophagales bacterium]